MKAVVFLGWLNYFTWHWALVFRTLNRSVGASLTYVWFLILAVLLTLLHVGIELERIKQDGN